MENGGQHVTDLKERVRTLEGVVVEKDAGIATLEEALRSLLCEREVLMAAEAGYRLATGREKLASEIKGKETADRASEREMELKRLANAGRTAVVVYLDGSKPSVGTPRGTPSKSTARSPSRRRHTSPPPTQATDASRSWRQTHSPDWRADPHSRARWEAKKERFAGDGWLAHQQWVVPLKSERRPAAASPSGLPAHLAAALKANARITVISGGSGARPSSAPTPTSASPSRIAASTPNAAPPSPPGTTDTTDAFAAYQSGVAWTHSELGRNRNA